MIRCYGSVPFFCVSIDHQFQVKYRDVCCNGMIPIYRWLTHDLQLKDLIVLEVKMYPGLLT